MQRVEQSKTEQVSQDRRSTTLKSLESLRISAAVAVVLAHCVDWNVPLLQPFLGGRIFLGSLGVDIFFVISGFVMGFAMEKAGSGGRDAVSFMFGRAVRLVPLYTLVTLAASTYLSLRGKPVGFLHLAQSLLFFPTIGQPYVLDPVVGVGWTLRFEMYFYLLVGVGILLDKKLVVPVAGLVCSVVVWFWSGFYFGAPVVLEFIAGFLLCVFWRRLGGDVRARLGFHAFLGGLLVSVVLLLLVSTGHDWGETDHGALSLVPRLWIVFHGVEIPRVVAWGVPSIMLVYFCVGLEDDMKWRFAFLGKYTYSVYLLQFFALPLSTKMARALSLPDLFALAFSATLLGTASVVSFRFVESPFIKWRRQSMLRIGKLAGGSADGRIYHEGEANR